MAILPLFQQQATNKRTLDTDDGRINESPVIVRDGSGRFNLFYQKKLKSGRLTGGHVTYTDPSLDCNVASGTGEINGTPVVWPATPLTLTASTYTLIYVDLFGTVSQEATSGLSTSFPFDMNLLKDRILIALVNVGATSIVRISEIEKDGYYIFHRRQILSGSDWVWDDIEYKLNVGTSPKATYDSVNDKIYLSYQKDGSTFVRLLNMSDPLTFEDLPHSYELNLFLYPDPYPVSGAVVTSGSGKASHRLSSNLFVFGDLMSVGFRGSDQYLYLPYVESSYFSYMIGDPQLEIFTKSGSTYTLEATFTLPIVEIYSGFDTEWLYTTGKKYLGLRVSHSLYPEDYVTDPNNYVELDIPVQIDVVTTTSPTVINAKIYPEVSSIECGSSSGQWVKTFELEQIFTFEEDPSSNLSCGSSVGQWIKTAEFEQIFEIESDNENNLQCGSSKANHIITNS